MNDRELLEMAAKALGIQVEWRNNPDEAGCECLAQVVDGVFQSWWMPLDDDGDAFRLMVKFRMWQDCDDNICCVEDPDDYNGDENAATRRAIVRAAAQIGRSII